MGHNLTEEHKQKISKGNRNPHRRSKEPIYGVWRNMKNRCYREKDIRFHRYGGRGIGVCERWMDFNKFYEDMGDKPMDKTLDRIDGDKDYCKENCRWASHTEQANNRVNNHIVEYRGKQDTLANWSKKLSLNYSRTKDRLRAGWTPEKAFETPVRKKRITITSL